MDQRSLLLAVGALAVAAIGCGGVADPCGNEVLSTIPSPAGGSKAVVFRRSCGATTGYSTQVSVLRMNDVLLTEPTLWRSTESGNALTIDGDLDLSRPGRPGQLAVTWEGEVLHLRYDSGLRVGLSAATAGGVSVTHRRGPDDAER